MTQNGRVKQWLELVAVSAVSMLIMVLAPTILDVTDNTIAKTFIRYFLYIVMLSTVLIICKAAFCHGYHCLAWGKQTNCGKQTD